VKYACLDVAFDFDPSSFVLNDKYRTIRIQKKVAKYKKPNKHLDNDGTVQRTKTWS